ncbi:MAG TPA: 50S ribosomal protein L33 [Patescibacteria group bacterium]
MAKAKKSPRILIALVCTKCGAQNYLTEKNKTNTTDKLTFNKYCNWCKERLPHKESTKLK